MKQVRAGGHPAREGAYRGGVPAASRLGARNAAVQPPFNCRHISPLVMRLMFNSGTAMKSSALVRVAAVAARVIAGTLFRAAPVAPQAAMTPQSRADTVLPGYWEYTTSAVGVRDTETKCVRPSEINRFFGGLSTRRWRCTYPVRQVGNGNARFEGTCEDRKGRRVNVRLNG